jgi:hypothetical protein
VEEMKIESALPDRVKKNILYIHIGTHKTGSTAIQNIISRNVKIDAKYIQPGDEFLSICEDTENNAINLTKSKEFKSFLLNELSRKYSKYIISEEEFSGNIFTCYKDSKNIAKRLKLATKDIFPSVKIIVYIRNQAEWIQSMYTQEIHQGGSLFFKDFLGKIEDDVIDWQHVIGSYESEFGKENIIVKRYDKSLFLKKNSFLKDFFETIQLDYSELIMSKKTYNVNSGYSRNALEFARAVNHGLSSIERQYLRHELQKIDSKKPFENYSFFSKYERNDFVLRHEESNNKILKKYFSDEDFLFSNTKITHKDLITTPTSQQDMLLLLTKMHLNHNSDKLYFIKIVGIVESKLKYFVKKLPYLELKIRRALLKYLH